ncbi:MAG: bifunctional diaminohydroxyphosphoribosylaminopyrimidine deaminase/5-amino-6-(5-phosphoribosylamino)uracil reductase RibD [Chelatococcus sp.]|uniref:bifunctional diaminohydroxyphosphoribosylaminopyrimidine deaminase/5-amino-6-(5-phosphoribosylamino)uracil reductase RibD n=1 Tax=Chelatococcus sp. TaxID=1953771 RepID=UPI0025BB7B62|nr:bifunctional diaminohydroxyphosphoribosylaminopyrimidine deaminase/5-amino-6-(5-phosphoribosylamino)uracil reductase RibD [Chelatococcus sp.]MBX3537568.1 bifunctional diaminohydroxyphosphoribosylaminopyrimidine deaminase/5-amino-6-(5-phosphoribosylamino)uracil reductase RibD [Chelatococcus sp.]
MSLDRRFMRDALALGARHLGLTWPNPSVGALIVAPGPEGIILGRGMTRPGGRPHGEPVALAAAGAAARGGTLYVTLEPCSHWGRSPPCVDAVIAAGIARVVSALEDPDPRVAGSGHARLRAAGIAVTTGPLAVEAERAHRGHILRVREGRPAVTVKLAMTADGFAGVAGERLRITGPIANDHVHLMRAHADVLMVGVGTVLADDPALNVRLPGMEARSPVRVIIDTALRTPPSAVVARTALKHPTWIIAGRDAPVEAERALVAQGVEVMRLGSVGTVDLAAALRLLATRGVTRVFCEGGPRLADALAAAGLVDELVTVTGPRALRALSARPGITALGPHLGGLVRGGIVKAAATWDVATSDVARNDAGGAVDGAVDRFTVLERPSSCLPES